MVSCMISLHSSCNWHSSVDKHVGCPACLAKCSQTCSIWDKFENRSGQSKVVTWRKHFSDTLTVCGRALYSWKMPAGNLSMNSKLCGSRVSRTYRWSVKVPLINVRGYRVSYKMARVHETITADAGAVCCCKRKGRIKMFTTGPLQTYTVIITTHIVSWFVAEDVPFLFHSVAVRSRRAWHYFKRKRRWAGVIGSARNGRRDTKCPSPRLLATLRPDQGSVVKVLPVFG